MTEFSVMMDAKGNTFGTKKSRPNIVQQKYCIRKYSGITKKIKILKILPEEELLILLPHS